MSWGQRTNPNDVTKTINGNRNFVYAPGVFGIEEDITNDASYGSDGHAVHVMCDKIRKVLARFPQYNRKVGYITPHNRCLLRDPIGVGIGNSPKRCLARA